MLSHKSVLVTPKHTFTQITQKRVRFKKFTSALLEPFNFVDIKVHACKSLYTTHKIFTFHHWKHSRSYLNKIIIQLFHQYVSFTQNPNHYLWINDLDTFLTRYSLKLGIKDISRVFHKIFLILKLLELYAYSQKRP